MKPLMLIAGLFVFVTLILALVAFLKKARQPAIAYAQAKPLTDPEQTLYWRLVEALPECVILSQVTFSRFLEPEAAPRSAEYRALLNKIAQKSADFVVCLKDFSLVAVVELDDGSHDAAKDAERDRLLAAAGVQVVRFTAREMPAVAGIREALAGEADAKVTPA